MVVKALVDNWTLQNAGELLHGQRDGESADELDVDGSTEAPKYQPVSQDVVALACVCQLAQHIVLADELVVDAAFTESWSDLPAIGRLQPHGLLSARDFRSVAAHWVPLRELLADQLSECAPGIRRQHEENKNKYQLVGKSSDEMLSQVLWGTAGMLARAELSRLPYSPHPLRERLLLHSRFLGAVPNAHQQLSRFVDGQRLKLYQRTSIDGVYGRLHLPPIFVEVINESSMLSDIIPAAIELRGKYGDLREWLGKLQAAFDAEDMREILARQKVLQDVSDNIDRLVGGRDGAGVSAVQVGLDFLPKVTLNGSIGVALRNRVGVRAQINRLVLTPPGRSAFRRLLRLLGEEHTERGVAIEGAFYAFQTR